MSYLSYRSPATDLTVADIFREYWEEYRQSHKVTAQQAKVVGSLMACRTAQLGGRIDQCRECGAWVFRFNSCRDRHCNQCQKYERAKWVEKQKVTLLPIPYFHGVFTVDHGLNPLIQANRKAFYDLLFEVAQETLKEVGQELGCQLGFTMVLHTWGQKLDYHVHLHCIITGGGLSLDGERWVRPKNGKYLCDVVALSARYRDKLLTGVEQAVGKGEMAWPTEGAEMGEMLGELREKKWEVFLKPFEKPEAVYEYLSRYVHQVAISNYRLEQVENGQVRFEYYENRERAEAGGKGKKKSLTLPVQEFMRRWLNHVLPKGYKRIRYYGLHHSSARAEKLPRSREKLGLERALPEVKELSLLDWLQEIMGDEVDRCPHCGAEGSLFERREFEQLPWLVGLMLALFGEPTRAGVRR